MFDEINTDEDVIT
jgi:uncharacterized protein YehS (DUF1456 family)